MPRREVPVNDQPGCSAVFNGIPGCWYSLCGLAGTVAGAVFGAGVGYREFGVPAAVVGVPLGAAAGAIGGFVLVWVVGGIVSSVGVLLHSGSAGVVRMWTPRTQFERGAALLAVGGAGIGGTFGARHGAGWAVACVFAGAVALPVVAMLVAILVALIGGSARRPKRADGESHVNG
jgi:hypothetical protein